jgi:hypothetical protein
MRNRESLTWRVSAPTIRSEEGGNGVKTRTGRYALPFAAGCVVGVGVIGAPAPPAAAEQNNCSNFGNYHAGHGWAPSGSSTTHDGVKASLLVRHGAVCNTDTSGLNRSTAWVMISGGTQQQWSQVGHIRWYGSSTYPFAQDRSALTGTHTVKSTSSPVTLNTERVAKTYAEYGTSNCGSGMSSCFKNYFDGTLVSQSLFTTGNMASPWFFPTGGETNYKASDIPGLYGSSERFSAWQYRPVGGSWSKTSPPDTFSINSNPDRWTRGGQYTCGSSTHCYEIWTSSP